jgi:hypothetical protein
MTQHDRYIHGTIYGPDWNSTRVDCPFTGEEAALVADMQARTGF